MISPRIFAGFLAGLTTMFVVNALAAAVVIDPLFGDDYPELTGDGTGIDWPLLIAGYALIAAMISGLHHQSNRLDGWVVDGLAIGVPIGLATFAGVHIVQAGYTTIDNTAWVMSGVLDIFGPIACSLTIAYLTLDKRKPTRPAQRVQAQLAHLINDPDRTETSITELEAVAETINSHLTELRRTRPTR